MKSGTFMNTRERKNGNFTCHPSGLRFIRDNEIPVSKSVQLMVPSEDAAYIESSFIGLNL
jgi:hypothetical protein